MSKDSKLIELRNDIDEVYQKLMRENEGPVLLNRTILDRVKLDLGPKLIKFQSELIEMALTKLLNDVSRRGRKGPGEPEGPDLFGQYRGIPQVLSLGRGIKKATFDLSVSEASQWLDAHPPKPAKDPHKALRKFVAMCLDEGASGDDTIGAIIERLGPEP